MGPCVNRDLVTDSVGEFSGIIIASIVQPLAQLHVFQRFSVLMKFQEVKGNGFIDAQRKCRYLCPPTINVFFFQYECALLEFFLEFKGQVH